jgi:acetyl-CoA synthetase
MFQIESLGQYNEAYAESVRDPENFWSRLAGNFIWRKKWERVLDWDFKKFDVKWFIGGRLNITENCLDRHLETHGGSTALIWESNNPEEPSRRLTYSELHEQVCRFAGVMRSMGVKKGDRVCIYMPMVPELAVSVLATARLGAIHSVVFAGFSSNSLMERIQDSGCSFVITSDEGYRGARTIPVKQVVDDAVEKCPTVKKMIVVRRTGAGVNMKPGRDFWWHEAMSTSVAPVSVAEETDAEDMLFILYTSGSTGKPKGVVHTCGGYMVYTWYTFLNVFQYKHGEVFWCTADIGWITGHSYTIYGPLLAGATTLMFEGIPTFPDAGRFWQVVDKHRVNIFYTAPTAIRALEAAGLEFVKPYSLDSLRVLGSVGEPINHEAWEWYHLNIGKGNCPVVDTWWQTETGGIMISPLAGITPEKPTFATLPLPGIQPVLVDNQGREISGHDVEGNLCIRFPWPGMLRTTYGDHGRCRNNYFSSFGNLYFTGDGCKRDEDGYYRIIGRVDDVINVSGHRLGTAEVENAINEHPLIVESAVVAYPHEIKGQGIYAFVICEHPPEDIVRLKREVHETVTKVIGPIAKPDKIQVVTGLPKTRSGKIMRRILRKIAEKDFSALGDTSTLLDPAVVEHIKSGTSY